MDERISTLIAALTGDDVTDETRAAALAELEDTQVGETETELLDHFRKIRAGEVEGTEPDDLGVLRPIATAVEHLQGEAARRYELAEQAAAEAAARAEEAATLETLLLNPETVEASETPPADEDEDKGDEGGDEQPEAEASETPPAAEETETPAAEEERELVPAAAKRPSLAELAAARPAPAARPAAPAVVRPRWESLNPREPIATVEEAAERIIAASEELVATAPGVTFKRPVCRVYADMPDEMMLKEGDVRGNTRKILELTANATDPETWDRPELQAITASGGWCAPPQPRYDVMTIAETHRPFRGGLPSTGAERGAITVIRGLGLEGVTTGGPSTADAAIGVWDADTDEVPGNNVKTRQAIACPTPVTCELQAIYNHRKVGNFQGRSWPELIAAETRRTLAAHARVAETELLDYVNDTSLTITEAAVLGSARDLLVSFGQARRQMISRQRMSPDARLRLWLPEWAPAMAVADIQRQQASGELEALRVTDEQWLGMVRALGFNVGLYSDSPTGAGQVWGDIADNTNLRNWPTTVLWFMYPEGSFFFLDGGTLDLGVYRDGTLIGTNDYAIFAETFEQGCFVGIDDAAIAVTSTVCPNGESQVATDETASVCSGS